RVRVVVLAVGQRHLDVNHRIPGSRTRGQRLLDALPHGRNELGRDRATLDLVDELKAFARVRLDVDVDDAELARTTGLAHEATLDLLGGAADRLTVGDLRLADVGLGPDQAPHPDAPDLPGPPAPPGTVR